jgi:hypothetical protein
MSTRNQIADALLALLAGAYPFVTASRRNRDPKRIGVAEAPCLFLLEHEETYERPSPSLPPKRRLDLVALVYVDAGADENAVPAAILDDILDALDAALAPESFGEGRLTIGGRVFSAMIDGTIERSSGDMTGKAAAAIPIAILVP